MFVQKLGYDIKSYREKECQMKVFPFNSKERKMCTIYKIEEEEKYYACVKGDPNYLIPFCNHFMSK